MRAIVCGAAMAAVVGTLGAGAACRGDVIYGIDDGTAELGITIDPGEDMIWFNRFAVEPGGGVIDSISVAYGRPGLTQALNGLAVTILLYEDTNGGSPQDGVLLASVATTVANAHTNILNLYPITPTAVSGDLLVGVLFRNITGVSKPIAAFDTTAPSLAGRSFLGFGVGLNPANLGAIPAGQFGPIEGFGQVGNFLIRGHGVAIPGPGTWIVVVMAGCGRRAKRKFKVQSSTFKLGCPVS